MNDPPFTPDPVVFVGWCRAPGGPWRRVCRASTWDGCWDLLLRVEPAAAAGLVQRLVNDGRHPEQRKRPR